jgi:hypothetical protein
MTRGARTPEELEMLLEDAFVTRNGDLLTPLFEDGAVLAASNSHLVARGRDEIARLAATLWEHNRTYLADPRRIVQTHETALVVAENGINVVRRGSDGGWRYTIALLSLDNTTEREDR